jgi:hypothetical protein
MADVEFIDCTSLSISYDVMGIATLNFTVVKDSPGFPTTSMNTLSVGGRIFEGYVTSASLSQIPNTPGWYETRVTLLATAT